MLLPLERVIGWRLVEGRIVSVRELVQACYGDRDDGGPDDAHGNVGVYLFRLRRFIPIHNVHGLGFFIPDFALHFAHEFLAWELATFYDNQGPAARELKRETIDIFTGISNSSPKRRIAPGKLETTS